jgi:hypothetical protein
MAGLGERLVGAATLNSAIYEDVEADKGATVWAIVIVILSSISVGIAQAIDWFWGGGIFSAIAALIGYPILAIVGWLMWVVITWIVGTKIMPEPETSSNLGELVRTVGFAQVPGIFRIFSAIPILGFVVTLVVWLWMLAAFVVAVRQALDFKSTGRAIVVCAIGWIINGLLVEWGARGLLAIIVAAIGGATTGGG